ncbi:MAG: carbohydrate kinase family protein [Acidiferrobacterales bacterium]|nr:carbohydrate kinase family protein [Acidiferrobacterales bacterium]
MKTLITGSMAFDTIFVFEDKFQNHILPEQTHMLNVSFFAPTMRRYQGGCAGNIAYNLKLLGGEPIIMATVGQDFAPYAKSLADSGISDAHIAVINDEFTAQAFIINDIDNNQVNAFHPGAMNYAHQNKVSDVAEVELGIVSPDGRDAMIEHASQFSEAGIPFFFDPGQGLPMFSGEELIRFVDQANYLILNDYESHMLMDKSALSLDEVASKVEVLVVTKGAKGSVVYVDGESIDIAAAPISAAKDPTGCGDSYRAGMMFGLSKGCDWKTNAQIGALCGAIKVESIGTQKHSFTQEQFAERYQQAFGQPLDIFI